MCERLLARTKELGFASDERRIPVSISIGAAYDGAEPGEEPAGERTLFFDALIQAAEEALAEAIEEGGSKAVYINPAELEQ